MNANNILLVSAHPEPRSLTSSLTSFAANELRMAGHQVRVSDLYAMKWRAGVDADDFTGYDPTQRLDVMHESGRAYASGTLAPEIAAEQEKLLWSDAVVLQFPLWWMSMPALLKGWVDRVFTYGFGYGTLLRGGGPYGDGTLAGRRAMVSVTIGADQPAFSDRGIHGRIDDVLFPIHHGLLYYTGMDVLPPFVVWDAQQTDDDRYGELTQTYRDRLRALFTTEPLAYRPLKGGDYTRSKELKPEVEAPGTSGLDIHLRQDGS